MDVGVTVRAVLVNPARAGMILELREQLESSNGKPRASGDDPTSMTSTPTPRP